MKDRRFKSSILVVMAMVVLAAGQAKAVNKVLYRLNLKKGQKYYLKMTTEQNVTQTFMGKEQRTEQTITMGTNFDIKDVDAKGNAWVQYTYKLAKLRQKGPMGEIVFDSSKTDVNIPLQAQGFAALLGESFSLKLTPDGKVEEIKGLDKMRSNIEKKLPPGPMRQGLMAGLERFVSKKAIKELTESSMGIYPSKAVGVGDSWSKTVTLSYGFGVIMENKWTLKERKGGVATIESVSTIKPNPKATPMKIGTTKISYQFSGKQQGQIKMREATGHIIRSKADQQLEGVMKIEVSGTGAQPQEMSLPMNIKSVITTEMSVRKK